MYPHLDHAQVPRFFDLLERYSERRRNQRGTFRRGLHDMARYVERVGGQLSAPLSVSVDLTNACNQNCLFCYRGGRDGLKQSGGESWLYRSRANLERLLDALQAMGVATVTLTGGEPTTHPRWLEAVAAVKDRGLAVTLVTNGTLMSEADISRLSELLVADSDVVELSVDAADQDTYGSIRRSERFGRLLATLGGFRDCGIPFTTMTLLMRDNHRQAVDILRLASAHGAHVTALEAPFPKQHVQDFSAFAAPEDVLSAYESVLDSSDLAEQEISLNFLHFSIMAGIYDAGRSRFADGENPLAGCHAGHATCAIDIRDRVHLCSYLVSAETTCAGHLRDVPLPQIWEAAQRMRHCVGAQCSSGCPAFDLDQATNRSESWTTRPLVMSRVL